MAAAREGPSSLNISRSHVSRSKIPPLTMTPSTPSTGLSVPPRVCRQLVGETDSFEYFSSELQPCAPGCSQAKCLRAPCTQLSAKLFSSTGGHLLADNISPLGSSADTPGVEHLDSAHRDHDHLDSYANELQACGYNPAIRKPTYASTASTLPVGYRKPRMASDQIQHFRSVANKQSSSPLPSPPPRPRLCPVPLPSISDPDLAGLDRRNRFRRLNCETSKSKLAKRE